ncbi:hypothetical protein OQA88_6641 [Cercophora sp. LCS_1]
MSRLFYRKRPSTPAPQCQHDFLSLLDPADAPDADTTDPAARPVRQHRRMKSLPAEVLASRAWLGATERRSSGEQRQPPRKLVKEMNGSGRPSFSHEISDSDAEKETKGLVRRQIARLKEFYRRAEKSSTS